MRFSEIGTFDVAHQHLAWPWIAVDASRTCMAFATPEATVATRTLTGDELAIGPTFALPIDLRLPTEPDPSTGHRGAEKGIHGLAIASGGARIAVCGNVDGKSVVATMGVDGELVRSRLDVLTQADFVAHAVAFDRSGTRLWISAESGSETAIILVDAATHALHGIVTSAPFPPPAAHELHVHHADDAVLLLAACGQDGTFARIAGWSDGPPIAVPTALDGGAESAGLVGFSADGARVHLVESDVLRTHAWPGLEELSSVELADDFVSSYSGAVLGHRILVDGQDADTEDEDAVMEFDRTAIRGHVVSPPVPSGMWVGRIGSDAIVTVESKGEPARARVFRIPAPPS